MSETNLAEFETKTPGQRNVMQILYGLHTLAWFSAGVFAVIALIINYIRREDEADALYLDHHNYMIRTFWFPRNAALKAEGLPAHARSVSIRTNRGRSDGH